MTCINQHGDRGELFDIRSFFEDVDRFFEMGTWSTQIEWCIGEKSKELEKTAFEPKTYPADEFREIYSSISQTIDGTIFGYSNSTVV